MSYQAKRCNCPPDVGHGGTRDWCDRCDRPKGLAALVGPSTAAWERQQQRERVHKSLLESLRYAEGLAEQLQATDVVYGLKELIEDTEARRYLKGASHGNA